ncbi:E3 ubiquitin-protein ligase RNF128a isoform X2 [Esox lucius]|uniref:RING-type domain-containing protein n=1 Tax=Esox lucius TaxID=8010 RepID=A0AAY5JXR5_ESOLU|nr:E3 ubiquitin-protein ligase RNF128a isoform X2 [Esox lucius]
MERTGKPAFSLVLFTLLCLISAQHAAAHMGFWRATVHTRYLNTSNNQPVFQSCECGLYGAQSPVVNAFGKVTLPISDPLACDPQTGFNGSDPWIALIQRGNCTFAEKIKVAAENGAAGVVIYNLPGTGDWVTPMKHHGTGDMVAIMIGNRQGMEIVELIKQGIPVSMAIDVGQQQGPWLSHYSVFFVSISFFVVTAATVGYFIFYSARRLNIVRLQNRKQKQLKAEAKKAIGRLQVRMVKHGDEETGPDADTCAVCIDAYKSGDVLTILTCNHFFHKTCIEPWLLEHRTCPMCKCDILKALGVEPEEGPSPQVIMLPPETRPFPRIPEDAHSETASSGYASVQSTEDHSSPTDESNMYESLGNQPDPGSIQVDIQPHYDNLGFECDSQNHREPRT